MPTQNTDLTSYIGKTAHYRRVFDKDLTVSEIVDLETYENIEGACFTEASMRELEKNIVVAKAELALMDAQLAQCPVRKRHLLAKTRSLILRAKQIASLRNSSPLPDAAST